MGDNHHHHGSCEHDHDDSPEIGIHYTLYTKINLDAVQCFNECVEGSGKDVFKSWENKLDFDKYVDSDADEELLFNIPFTGNVKLKGMILIGGENDSHPSKVRLFKNRPNMSFDSVEVEADQEFDMQPDSTGVIEYKTKVVKFASVHHLSIHIPKNFGAESTRVYYIGLKGEFTEAARHEVTVCCYEAQANPADHKIDSLHKVQHQIQ
ncbi:PITH domain-containing protein 1 [Nymphon striatum]|nr:PITH domain-containing protein 1 [Nymphon striatum]